MIFLFAIFVILVTRWEFLHLKLTIKRRFVSVIHQGRIFRGDRDVDAHCLSRHCVARATSQNLLSSFSRAHVVSLWVCTSIHWNWEISTVDEPKIVTECSWNAEMRQLRLSVWRKSIYHGTKKSVRIKAKSSFYRSWGATRRMSRVYWVRINDEETRFRSNWRFHDAYNRVIGPKLPFLLKWVHTRLTWRFLIREMASPDNRVPTFKGSRNWQFILMIKPTAIDILVSLLPAAEFQKV